MELTVMTRAACVSDATHRIQIKSLIVHQL